MAITDVLEQKWSEFWRGTSALCVSVWAQGNRIIAGSGAELGRWRNSRVPYLEAIMDAYNDPQIEEISITGPAQSGKTEAAFNMMGYTVDIDPTPLMYVHAREEDADDIFRDRLNPMFRESPALARHLTGRAWDVKIGRGWRFDRMPLYLVTARSASALSSKPIGRLFLDETDKYPATVGREGSPLALARRRGTTFPDFKVIYICTLTTAEGFIYLSINRSNKQRYWLACPYCGVYFDPRITQLKVDPPDCRDVDKILKTECVYYECESCRGRIIEKHRSRMLAEGVWCPEGCKVEKDGTLSGKPLRGRRHSGFWISGLISPWLSWSRILAGWFAAVKEDAPAPGVLREYINQVIGDIWSEQGQRIELPVLAAHIGDFSRGTVPDGGLMLVASADYHETEYGESRIDYEVRAFGYELRNWVISSGSLNNWKEFEGEVLHSRFPWSNPEGPNKGQIELAIVACFIDSGYKPDEVYDFCLRYPGLCFPTKGASHAQRAPLVTGRFELGSGVRAARYRGMLLIHVDTQFFKDRVTSWASKEKGSPGCTEFYAEIPERYFRDFSNEHKIKERDDYGRESWVWRPVSKGAQTHHLDTAVLAAAAAHYKGIQYARSETKRKLTLSEMQRDKRSI